ncbi:MAG: MerR family transcriptional regulator [Lachnospiraceae bacterium]|nr:MerR family transcriptional regulator [Lachnospiraceae bacterium]
MSNYLLISDAAKEVRVESHVLRYWEEELHLPIKRNELGHRYYTVEDVERFKQIKNMKERGLQLKAIKMILRDGKLNVLPQVEENIEGDEDRPHMAIDIVGSSTQTGEIVQESREEKAQRLQWLLQQLIRETLRENNQELCRDIKESIVKELDYQFRTQEEREEERELRQEQRNEEYYRMIDELLRKKSTGNLLRFHQKDVKREKKNKRKAKRNKANVLKGKMEKVLG